MDKNWQEMERYATSLMHASYECCSNVEDGTLVKQQRMMTDDIVFRSRDANMVEAPTIDSMVISATIGPAYVKRIMIDCGSSVNIIFKKTYDQMKMETKDLKPCKPVSTALMVLQPTRWGILSYQLNWGKVSVGECESYRS